MHIQVKSDLLNYVLQPYQQFFEEYKNFSKHFPVLGRLGALPIVLIDVSVDTLIIPLICTIESIVVAALFLYASTFRSSSKNSDDFNSLGARMEVIGTHIEMSGIFLSSILIKILMAPVKILYRTACIIKDPIQAVSISE